MPSSDAFGYNAELLGAFWPIHSVWMLVLGEAASDLSSGSAVLIFFVFSFFVVVVLLNLC